MKKILNQLHRAQKLLKASLLEPSVYILYTYYLLRDGEPTSLKEAVKATKYAQPTIVYGRKVLTTLGLLRIERSSKISIPHILEEPIKMTESLRGQLEDLKQSRDQYHPIRYQKKKSTSCELKQLLTLLPEEHRSFTATPVKLTALKKLTKELDLERYTRWFLRHKLGKTVEGFNLGIFTFRGIVDEYLRSRVKTKKADSYKKVSDRKETFKKKARQFKEEMEDGLL